VLRHRDRPHDGSFGLLPTAADEQYCYKRGDLCVTGFVGFAPSNAPAAVDASGREDFGNIDSFRRREDGVWVAVGDRGVLEARDPEVKLRFAR
jgi:hypothetical protein